MSGLDQYFDACLELPEDRDRAWFEHQHRARLVAISTLAGVAVGLKRRLGGDATADELARDKKVGRYIQHFARDLSERWGTGSFNEAQVLFPLDPKMLWTTLATNCMAVIGPAKIQLGTFAILNDCIPWGNAKMYLLTSEEERWRRVVEKMQGIR